MIFMSDLEGLARVLLESGQGADEVESRLVRDITTYKEVDPAVAESLAKAVLREVEKSSRVPPGGRLELLRPLVSGVTMGEQGVGCRGTGDFFVHRLIAELSYSGAQAILSPRDMDDAGAVALPDGRYLVVKMEGMHSRLSDFPFLAGFHVTRAAFRDLYVKGAAPTGLVVDLHLADDADVGKLFDFTCGVSAVCELAGCPVLGGSTLRIGGDMVIGTRMTGGVAAMGVADRLFPRREVQGGDAIVMTEGAGGGTICTTAIYSGMHDVALETLNLKFLKAARIILEGGHVEHVHCMADVTNGGIRADLHEISAECGFGAIVREKAMWRLVNPKVLEMLRRTGVDYLGVSLDSLLVFCAPAAAGAIVEDLAHGGVGADVVGEITRKREIRLVRPGGASELMPRFRESPYTAIKKVVDSGRAPQVRAMEERLRQAAEEARKRGRDVVTMLRENEPHLR